MHTHAHSGCRHGLLICPGPCARHAACHGRVWRRLCDQRKHHRPDTGEASLVKALLVRPFVRVFLVRDFLVRVSCPPWLPEGSPEGRARQQRAGATAAARLAARARSDHPRTNPSQTLTLFVESSYKEYNSEAAFAVSEGVAAAARGRAGLVTLAWARACAASLTAGRVPARAVQAAVLLSVLALVTLVVKDRLERVASQETSK